MAIAADIYIPSLPHNDYIILSNDIPPIKKRQIEKRIEGDESFYMCADSMSHGCGSAIIGFWEPYGNKAFVLPCGDEKGFLFGFTCNVETLTDIINGLIHIRDAMLEEV